MLYFFQIVSEKVYLFDFIIFKRPFSFQALIFHTKEFQMK